MKVFCPYIAGLCDEGYPGDHQCVMWDEEEEVCLIKENVKYIVEGFRVRSKIQAKFQAQTLHKGVNLEQRGGAICDT